MVGLFQRLLSTLRSRSESWSSPDAWGRVFEVFEKERARLAEQGLDVSTISLMRREDGTLEIISLDTEEDPERSLLQRNTVRELPEIRRLIDTVRTPIGSVRRSQPAWILWMLAIVATLFFALFEGIIVSFSLLANGDVWNAVVFSLPVALVSILLSGFYLRQKETSFVRFLEYLLDKIIEIILVILLFLYPPYLLYSYMPRHEYAVLKQECWSSQMVEEVILLGGEDLKPEGGVTSEACQKAKLKMEEFLKHVWLFVIIVSSLIVLWTHGWIKDRLVLAPLAKEDVKLVKKLSKFQRDLDAQETELFAEQQKKDRLLRNFLTRLRAEVESHNARIRVQGRDTVIEHVQRNGTPSRTESMRGLLPGRSDN